MWEDFVKISRMKQVIHYLYSVVVTKFVKVTLKGLKGGHSGIEINEGRANANKCMVRNVRQEIKEKLKKAIKDGLSEDLEKDAENDLQKLHDKYIKQLEGLMDEKEKEIMTV